MDQDVINLAKAIRQKESGGDFNAVGDNGTSRGAYQWQAATWKGHAKEILGDENAEMSRDNQQAVAYGMIKTWKDQGLNPAQIAAKWNSGSEKGWENKIGTTIINGKPIQYNVPQYVKDVTDTYQQFKLETQQAPQQEVQQPETPQAEQPGLLASIGNAITDPFLALGGGVANLIRPMIGREASGEKIPSIFGGEGVNPIGYRDGQELGAVDTAQQLAGNVAMAGSNFVGAGAVKSIGTGILSKVSPSILSLMKQGALATGAQMGGQAAEEGRSASDVLKQTAIGTAIGGVAGPVIGKTVGAIAKIPGALKVKTAEEILSTPVEKLSTLNPTERSFYFSKKAEQIAKNYEDDLAKFTAKHEQDVQNLNKAFEETTTKITKTQEAAINSVKSEAENLNKQLADASIAEVESLKPKLIEAMRKNSNTYRQLVDDEISQVADVQVTNNEIAASIRNRFSDDPAKAEQIINILKTKTEGPQTVKSVYENTKALRKDIGSGARQGNRTLTSEEYNTTEAISALLDFLKNEKGVDLSKANKFWAEYAPIKNKLYKSIQPYKPSGTETATFKTFAKTLASNDPYNQKFIAETEKLLGVSFKDSKAREILSKIDANKKAQIAAKIESATKLQQAKATKLEQSIAAKESLKEAKTNLKLQKQIETEKQELIKLEATLNAERRTLLRRIIGGLLVVLGLGKPATDAVLSGY